MHLSFFVLASLAVAGSSSASLSKPAHHSAGHLFIRSDTERRSPVELYKGIDPQLEARGVIEPIKYNANIKRKCSHDILDFAPRHLKNDDGHLLGKRQTTTSPGTGTAYPEAGANPPAANTLPQAWVDKYHQVKAAGLIPDIPIAKENSNGMPDYPQGTDMDAACSWTLSKCNTENIYQAPDNSVAFGIDDGPTPDGTPDYITILNKYNISATHFLIGSAISWNPEVMKQLAAATPAQHLAVHTWSHTLQTTKTDMEVLGDLGWTMQIIYDISGMIPMYFRPPEGDVDARVKAIAKYVFGMQTVMWTHDADDWCLRQGKGTATEIDSCKQSAPDLATVRSVEKSWATPKTNSSGWISLNHETTDQAAKAFSTMVKAATSAGWNVVGNVADLQALPWYNNAYGPEDAPIKQSNILPTKDIINVTDSTAAKGSAQAPKLGNWAKSAATQNSSSGAQTSGSNASGSSSSSHTGSTTSSSSSSSTSGAMAAAPRVASALFAIGLIGTAVAMVI
jgi:chitin deacetylase